MVRILQSVLLFSASVLGCIRVSAQSVELQATNELNPPSNLSVIVESETTALITWSPPIHGRFSSFILKINLLAAPSETKEDPLIIDNVETSFHILKNCTPGATYAVQAFTVFDGEKSAEYASHTFTMNLHIPGKLIVWYRNETALLILWKALHPAGLYAGYNVSISPPEAIENIIFLPKEDNSGPLQASFSGLVPGRAYNILIHSKSEDGKSISTSAEYRTVPLKPVDVSVEENSITTDSFLLRWKPPTGVTDFDEYKISLNLTNEQSTVLKLKNEPQYHIFKDGLEPGKTYEISINTISGNVSSWPVSLNITLKPNKPGRCIVWFRSETALIVLCQPPNPAGIYSHYKISIEPRDTTNNDQIIQKSDDPIQVSFEGLFPGRLYKMSIQTVSNDKLSDPVIAEYRTTPLKPLNVSIDSTTANSFIARWKPPSGQTDFDKYEVTLSYMGKPSSVSRLKEEDRFWEFKDKEPGKTYQISVKTVSGKVVSLPVSIDFTL